MSRAYDIIKTPQDLSYLSWDETAAPSGLCGARAKAREGTGANSVFYKKSYTAGPISGACDCFAQLICARLMDYLEIDHAPTQLVYAYTQSGQVAEWVVRSKSYRQPGERAMWLSEFFELHARPEETPAELCTRMGWQTQVGLMAAVDYITATRNRDEWCFEVLCSSAGALRLSPLLPRGYSLANAFPRQTWRSMATIDMQTDCYLGGSSLEENLQLIPSWLEIPKLDIHARKFLLTGLSDVVLAPGFLEASWSIIQARWQNLLHLREEFAQ